MALISTGPFYYPAPPYNVQANPGTDTELIDAANERVGNIIRFPKTGTVTKIWWRTANVTTGATVAVRLVTIDASGIPTTTLYAAGSEADQIVGDGDDNKIFETELDTATSVTAGDEVGVVVVNPASSFGNIRLVAMELGVSSAMPYRVDVADSKQTTPFAMGLIYTGDEYVNTPDVWPGDTLTRELFNNQDTPDVVGALFQVPFPCRVMGVWALIDNDGDFDIKLLDGFHLSDDLQLSVIIDKDHHRSAAGQISFHSFNGTFVLAKDTDYRLIVEPSSTTDMAAYRLNMESAAQLDLLPGGVKWQRTVAKNPTVEGSWTDTDTGYPMIGLILDQLDDGSGGGGGGLLTHPGMTGGMHT